MGILARVDLFGIGFQIVPRVTIRLVLDDP